MAGSYGCGPSRWQAVCRTESSESQRCKASFKSVDACCLQASRLAGSETLSHFAKASEKSLCAATWQERTASCAVSLQKLTCAAACAANEVSAMRERIEWERNFIGASIQQEFAYSPIFAPHR